MMPTLGHYASEGTAIQMPPEQFLHYWPELQRELDLVKFMWEPWWTKDSIFLAVMSGRWQVWAAGHDGIPHFFLVTQLSYYPAGTILQSTLMFGNSLDESIDAMWAVIEQFARQQGCSRVEIVGRKGWERKLARYGLRPFGVALSCTVSELRMQ